MEEEEEEGGRSGFEEVSARVRLGFGGGGGGFGLEAMVTIEAAEAPRLSSKLRSLSFVRSPPCIARAKLSCSMRRFRTSGAVGSTLLLCCCCCLPLLLSLFFFRCFFDDDFFEWCVRFFDGGDGFGDDFGDDVLDDFGDADAPLDDRDETPFVVGYDSSAMNVKESEP